MQKFSEYLNDYILKENISFRKAAELCDVDRTLLRRYTTGERIPRNLDRVLKIAQGLSMSRDEEKKICLSYKISQMCKEEFEIMNHVEKMIQNVQKAKNKKYQKWLHGEIKVEKGQKQQKAVQNNTKYEWEENQVKKINGLEEIQATLKYMITDVANIKVKMKLEYTQFFNRLFHSFSDIHCQIEQIYVMKQVKDEMHKAIFDGFEQLLPIFFSGKPYKVYYQMDQELEDDEMMIISDKGCLLISPEKMQGVFTNKPAYRMYYQSIFEQHLKRCQLIGENVTNLYFMEEKCEQSYEMKAEIFHIIFFYQKKPEERVWIKVGEEEYGTFIIMERNIIEVLYKLMIIHM